MNWKLQAVCCILVYREESKCRFGWAPRERAQRQPGAGRALQPRAARRPTKEDPAAPWVLALTSRLQQSTRPAAFGPGTPSRTPTTDPTSSPSSRSSPALRSRRSWSLINDLLYVAAMFHVPVLLGMVQIQHLA